MIGAFLLDPRFSLYVELRDGELFGSILIDSAPRFAAGSLYTNVESGNGFANDLRDGDDLLDVRGGGDGDGLSDLRGFDFLDIRARTMEGSLGDNTTGVRLACWRLSRGPCSVRRIFSCRTLEYRASPPCLSGSMQAKVQNGPICSRPPKPSFELALCFAMAPAGNGCSNTNSDKGGRSTRGTVSLFTDMRHKSIPEQYFGLH